MATPHASLTHAREQIQTPSTGHRPGARRTRRLRSGLLVGAAAALTVPLLPGTAAADPARVTDPAHAARLVADASHRLEVLSEQVNEARVVLEQQEAAAAQAQQAAADAQAKLDALDGRIRQLARSAYTSDGLTQLDVLLTSDSAEEFVHQLGTLDAIAGHTNGVVAEVSAVAQGAAQAQSRAAAAAAEARKSYDAIAAQQRDLQAQISDYQRQYDTLTATQQQDVVRAHAGEAVAAPSGVAAPSAAAQNAVDTALAQVGDPYVYGAAGPNAFDCSGLMQYAYSAAGVSLPHSSSSQSRMGRAVSRSELQPGDLVFFYSPVSHVGMYIGNGQIVHASTSGQPVKVVSLNSLGSYNSARRIAGS
ncbi:MAG: C40 family peptidase [Geodermatophilales bacterium]|nr:C40 family peptidase [Geodermatophilales bacterium]